MGVGFIEGNRKRCQKNIFNLLKSKRFQEINRPEVGKLWSVDQIQHSVPILCGL